MQGAQRHTHVYLVTCLLKYCWARGIPFETAGSATQPASSSAVLPSAKVTP